jgi:hypothetical protein
MTPLTSRIRGRATCVDLRYHDRWRAAMPLVLPPRGRVFGQPMKAQHGHLPLRRPDKNGIVTTGLIVPETIRVGTCSHHWPAR